MSDMKQTNEFVENFALWEIDLREEGEKDEGIEDIKNTIRKDWLDPDKREWWIKYVKERADFRKELISMSKGITERIKNALG